MTVKEKILVIFEEEKGQVISGEALGEKLKVSRAAIWKAIGQLRDEGHVITAVAGQGYCLENESDVLTKESVEYYLGDREDLPEIHVYRTVDSTNTKAKQLILEGANHGTLIISEEQTKGKGRLGRTFHSPANKGLYFTIVLKPKCDISSALLITTLASVAVARGVKKLTGIPLGIKWVNDLYLPDGKKVCGILTEAVTDLESGGIESIVLGIGINSRAGKRDLGPGLNNVAGSLEEFLSNSDYESGKALVNRSQLCAEIWKEVMEIMEILSAGELNENLSEGFNNMGENMTENSLEALINEYKEASILIGQSISIFKRAGGGLGVGLDESGAPLEGIPATAVDITSQGALVVEYEDGTFETLGTGEVSVRFKA